MAVKADDVRHPDQIEDTFDWEAVAEGERPDAETHRTLRLANRALAKFPEMKGKYKAYAGAAAVDRAGILAPVGLFAPHLFLVALTVAVDDCPAVFDSQGGGDADAKPHLLLIAEGDVASVGRKRAVPDEQVARGAHLECQLADFRADGLFSICREIPIADREAAAARAASRPFHEAVVHDLGLQPPGVVTAEVAEGQPDARMERSMILSVVWPGRMVARDLSAAGGAHVGEERPGDGLVFEYVGGDGFAGETHVHLAALGGEADLRLAGRLLRPGDRAEQHEHDRL